MNTSEKELSSSVETACCIAGAGPSGAMLALLLARKGIPVILLEAAKDFERDFRGDTIHPPILEIMQQLGLDEQLLQLPHIKATTFTARFENHYVSVVDVSRSNVRSLKYPYAAVIPQARFLEFVIEEAQRYPHFQVIMGANVRELIKEDGVIRGVYYRKDENWHEVRAHLVVAADGRSSRLRALANLTPQPLANPVELLWFRLNKSPDVAKGRFAFSSYSRGSHGVLINRDTYWQGSYYISLHSYQKLRAAGLPALREAIAKELPEACEYVDQLQDWSQLSHLSVQISRLARWYTPGLLCLGDAAHVMSPIGGFGINLAVQDAVAAANVLHKPLQTGHVQVSDLETVQRLRTRATRAYQTYQVNAQKLLVEPFLIPSPKLHLARVLVHLPIQRILLTRLVVHGVGSERVD